MIITATLGFDERPVLHAVSEAGFHNIEKIYLIRPQEDDPRAVKAVSEIKKIAVLSGLRDEDVISFRVEVRDFWGAVVLINKLYREIISSVSDKMILCLSGGFRALVLEAYTAYILLSMEDRAKTVLRIDLETGDYRILISGVEIITGMDISRNELEVLKTLSAMGGLTLSEISNILVKPVSTIHRVLKKLLEKKYVVKKNNKYYITPAASSLLRIMGVEF